MRGGSRRNHKKSGGAEKTIKCMYLGNFGWEIARVVYGIKKEISTAQLLCHKAVK